MAKVRVWKAFQNQLIKSLQWGWFNLLLSSIKKVCRWLNQVGKYLVKEKRFTTVLIITLALMAATLFLGILPTTQGFEGNLIVKSISFTSIQPNKLLLKDFRSIGQISGVGSQKLKLVGTFESKYFPKLNQLNKLEIELPTPESQWSITSDNSQGSQLDLLELRLQKNTKIMALSYDSYNHQLSLTLQPAQPNKSSGEPSFLRFDPGTTPLQVTVQGYDIKSLNLQDRESDKPLKFNFSSTEFELPLLQPTTLYITISDSNQQGFWRDIAVKEVKFEKLLQTGDNFNDNVYDSTIVSGKIRIADQELALEENQFLNIKEPGIQNLSRLQIVHPKSPQEVELKVSGKTIQISDPPKGLEVVFSGRTSSIQAGLNKTLPVARIEASCLEQLLPKDAVIALISFTSALIVSCLAWLVEYLSKSENKS